MAFLTMSLVLALTLQAEAKLRPTVDAPNGDSCWGDPDTSKDTDHDSLIISCCYDDGCWVCGVTPLPADDCEWEQASRGGSNPLPGSPRGPLDIAPIDTSISPGDGRRVVNICLAFDDHRLRISSPNATRMQCCSKELAYCVDCPQTMDGACLVSGFTQDWSNRIDGASVPVVSDDGDSRTREPQCDCEYCGPLY